jgi:hypothetical protein
MHIKYINALKYKLSHGLEFEKKNMNLTINKMLKVELDMARFEIRQIENYLAELEKHHNMSSDIFYDKFNSGELGDNSEYIKWYAYKDTHNKLMERAKEIEKIKRNY